MTDEFSPGPWSTRRTSTSRSLKWDRSTCTSSSASTATWTRRPGRSSTASTPRWARRSAPSRERCTGILLGRETYEMFEPAWSTRTVEDDPGAPFFNDTTKYVVSSTLTEGDVAQLGDHRRLRRRPHPAAQGGGRRRHLHQRQRPARARAARRRPDRRPASVRLSAHARPGPARVRRGRAGQALARGEPDLRQRRRLPALSSACREVRALRSAQGREHRAGGARAARAGGRGRGVRVDLGRRSHRAAAGRAGRRVRPAAGGRGHARAPRRRDRSASGSGWE